MVPGDEPQSPSSLRSTCDPEHLHLATPPATPSSCVALKSPEPVDTGGGHDGSPLLSPSPMHPGSAFHLPTFDWDNILIDGQEQDDEERAKAMADDDMLRFLDLHDEIEGPFSPVDDGGSRQMDGGQNLNVDDINPDEVAVVYDQDHPKMELGAIFPTMNDFKMAVRQFAINEEFELGVEKSDKERFRGYCKGDEQDDTMCNWKIVGRRRGDMSSVMVLDYCIK